MQRNDDGKLVANSLEELAQHIAEYASIARHRKHADRKRKKTQIILDDAEAKAYAHAADIIMQTVLIKEEHQEDNVP